MVAKAKTSLGADVRVQPARQKEPGRTSHSISPPPAHAPSPAPSLDELAGHQAPPRTHAPVTAQEPVFRSSRVSKTFALRIFQTIDMLVLIAGAMFAFAAMSPMGLAEVPFSIGAPFVMMPVWFAGALAFAGAYYFDHHETLLTHWGKTLSGLSAGGFMAILSGLAAGLSGAEMAVLLVTMAIASVTVLSLHANYMALIDNWHRNGALATNVVIVGATPNARKLIARNQETGELNVTGIFEDRLSRAPSSVEDVPVLGNLNDLLHWQHLPKVDRIIITVTSTATARVRHLIDQLRSLPQDVVLFMDMGQFNPGTTTLAEIAQAPMAYVSGAPKSEMRAITKRLQDLVLGFGLLVAFAPIMVLIAIAIKLDSRGPVFFRQKRHGFNNKVIEVLKFRSMHMHRDSGHMQQVTDNDDRITRVGHFIRRTSLDELPQLFNVLAGFMSLVGPRPHAVDMHTGDVESRLLVAEYAHRHRVKPGLTGWAQVKGSRGPLHNADDVRERVRLDVEYVDKANFWFDLWIMLKTAPVLLGDGENTR